MLTPRYIPCLLTVTEFKSENNMEKLAAKSGIIRGPSRSLRPFRDKALPFSVSPYPSPTIVELARDQQQG